MFISRENIPFKVLKQIHDPAYDIFRNAYANEMGDAEADNLMEDFFESNDALCDREMGWCVPHLGTVLRKVWELDFDNPLDKDALPDFAVSSRSSEFTLKKDESIVFFFHTNEKYGCFSQWYSSPFTVEGFHYTTAEQYMMAKKALLFHDYTIFDQILGEKDPQKCKRLGKQVKGFQNRIWNKYKEEIVYTANMAKFSQNYDIQSILLGTGNATLAEASPYDRIWGIGRDANDPKAKYPLLWKGENLLGRALERVRYDLAMQNQILEVADSGVHAGLDNCIDSYYVSPHQRKEMDKLLKMITGATAWMEGYLVLNPNLEDEE